MSESAPPSAPRPPVFNTSRGSAPRYMQVAEVLIEEIRNGTYPLGSLLPTEREICARFDISRHTTREAIRQLEDQGLVTRRAGIGTTIIARATQSRYTASISNLTELLHYAEKTRLQILDESWITIEDELAEIMPQARGQRWWKITALRYPLDCSLPISYTETLVPARFADISSHLQEPQASVFKLIEAKLGEPIAELRQDIASRSISPEVAATLKVATDSPGLYAVRSYFDRRGELLSVSLNTYPQDRFKISTRWRLDTTLKP